MHSKKRVCVTSKENLGEDRTTVFSSLGRNSLEKLWCHEKDDTLHRSGISDLQNKTYVCFVGERVGCCVGFGRGREGRGRQGHKQGLGWGPHATTKSLQ